MLGVLIAFSIVCIAAGAFGTGYLSAQQAARPVAAVVFVAVRA